MDNIFEEIILYDKSRPSPSVVSIIFYASLIVIASQIIFLALTRLMGINNVSESLDTEKNNEYEEWNKKGISPWFVLVSDLVNSTLYGPVVEEMIFRFFLMKLICVQHFKMCPLGANITQAFIFALMHCTNAVFSVQTIKFSNIQALSAGIAGLVSGQVYIMSNSLLPSLLAHVLNNAMASISEVWGYAKYRKEQSSSTQVHKSH